MAKKLWNIYRGDQFLGSVRDINEAAACMAYAEWAKCDAGDLRAVPA